MKKLICCLLCLALLCAPALADIGWGDLEQYASTMPYTADMYTTILNSISESAGGIVPVWEEPQPLEGDFSIVSGKGEEMTDMYLLVGPENQLYCAQTVVSLDLDDAKGSEDLKGYLNNSVFSMVFAGGLLNSKRPGLEDIQGVSDTLEKVLKVTGKSDEELIKGRSVTMKVCGLRLTITARFNFTDARYLDAVVAIAPYAVKF